MTRHLTSIWFALLPATLLCFAATRTLAQQPPPVSELVAKHPAPTNQIVSLAWTRSLDATVTGYWIYNGSSSGIYTNRGNAGNATNYNLKIPLFTNGFIRSFIAATCYNSNGIQSPFSNEVTFAGSSMLYQLLVSAGTNVFCFLSSTGAPPLLNCFFEAAFTPTNLAVLFTTNLAAGFITLSPPPLADVPNLFTNFAGNFASTPALACQAQPIKLP